MAKQDFTTSLLNPSFIEHKVGPGAAFVEKSGGPIDPFGDEEKKEKDALDMNAGEAFNKKDYTKVEAMGTDYPKKGNKGQMSDNNGDHFKTEYDVAPYGTDAGKSSSGQTVKRS